METRATWYYLEDSRQIGPYTRSELEALLERGEISADTLVWTKHRSWAPLSEMAEARPAAARPKQRRALMLLLAAALFCGGLSYEADTPAPSGAGDDTALLVSPDKSPEMAEPLTVASLPMQEEQPRSISAGNQLVQEYWRAIAHSKVIGRYEYYLRRSPSGSFAAGAAERVKELSSEALPETPKIKLKKEQAVAKVRPRTKKVRPQPAAATVAKKADGRCWSRKLDVCRERCRNGERLACQKLVRLGD
jgi:hypothetical protein